MKFRISLFALLYLSFSQSAVAIPNTAKLNEKISDVTFQLANGTSTTLYDLKGQKAIVVVFLSFDCPVSTNYSKPLMDMATTYGKQGVSFIGLTTNQTETRKYIAKTASHYRLGFPVYLDKKLIAADALAAHITPEAFVLDKDFVLRYRGRIDDQYYARFKPNMKTSTHDLQNALDEVLAVKSVRVAATKAIGCPIFRETPPVANLGSTTYYRDVLPILQKRCQTCHRNGEVGPFALMTYRQAKNWANDIKAYTMKRIMPPWKISRGAPFRGDRRLTDDEISTLAKWVDGGTPKGDADDAPPPRKFAEGWQLGTPDLVLTMPEDFQVGPTGSEVFRCVALPTNLPKDQYVKAVDFRPGNRRIVHHAVLLIDQTGTARRLQARAKSLAGRIGPNDDGGAGYSVPMGVGFLPQIGLGGWVPGQAPFYLPGDSAYLLPKGADVVVQVHYHRNGRTERDRVSVGLYFAKRPTKYKFKAAALAGGRGAGSLRSFFRIPAGVADFRLSGDIWAMYDFKLHSITPHMHYLGKKIALTMTPPGGKTTTLLAIDDWDFNWQETYFLKKPIHVRAGTRFDIEAFYDNSAKNPNNPNDPPRAVSFGERTTDEMCYIFFGGTADGTSRNLPLTSFRP